MARRPEGAIAKRPKIYFDVDPELRNRIKAEAALEGKTLREWATEALLEKLEDAIDAREGLAALAEEEGTVTLEELDREYMERQGALHR